MNKYKLHDVFLSYRRFEDEARTDAHGTEIAEVIYTYLKSKGLEVFWDRPEMETGSFAEQLQWQLEHSPNYIFIGTESAKHFRQVDPPEKDYVAEEVRYALKKYHEEKDLPNFSKDRTVLHIIPQKSKKQQEPEKKGLPADQRPYPPEIVEMMELQGVPLSGDLPTEKELANILKYITAVNRGNLWNAGSRWLEQMTSKGHHFAGLDIDRRIMPLAGTKQEEGPRLPIRVHLEEKTDAPLMDMIKNTPGHLYLIGEGGIGKTTALLSIMQEVYGFGKDEADIDRMRLNGQVPLFVELSRAPDTYGRLYEGGKSTFIQRAIYQQIRHDLKVKQVSSTAVQEVNEVFNLDPDTAVKPIHDLFTQEEGAPEYLLLLDGLNEVSRTEIGYIYKDGDGTEYTGKNMVVSMILQEIRMLMEECPNVRVILTSRSKEQMTWSEKTTLLYLSGVRESTIDEYLRSHGLPEKRIAAMRQNEKLKSILQIPLFLTLYATLEGEDEILTQGEILHLFFHQKKKALYTAKARSEKVDEDVNKAASSKQPNRLTAEMQNFILDFILPEIAWRMVQDDAFYIRQKGKNGKEGLRQIILRVLMDRSETAVCGENGKEVFSEYSQHSSKNNIRKTAKALYELLIGNEEDVEDAKDEIVEGILQSAIFSLGILQKDIGTYGIEYGFIHHHLRDYFAAVHQINRLRLAVYLHNFGEDKLAWECLTDWHEYPIHSEVRRFIGETLGEAHNAPATDNQGNWHYAVPSAPCDRNLIKRAFDIYRCRFHCKDDYSVWNLLEILKLVRDDLSGEDLHDLDLENCEVGGHILAHHNCRAILSGALIDEQFLLSPGYISEITSASYSIDDRFIITASKDGFVRIWDASTMQVISTLPEQLDILTYATYSPDGKYIATAANKQLILWDSFTKKKVHTFAGHEKPIQHVSFSSDSHFALTASADRTIIIWDLSSFQKKGILVGHTSWVNEANYSPDNRYIVSASSDGTARIWNAQQCCEISVLNKEYSEGTAIFNACYSPDGKYIVTAGKNTSRGASVRSPMIFWDAHSYNEIIACQGHRSAVKNVVFSPDGKYLVSGGEDKELIIRNTDTYEILQYMTCENGIPPYGIAFSHNGKYMAISSSFGTFQIFSMDDFQNVGKLSGHISIITSADFSPNGRTIAVTSMDGEKRIWELTTKRILKKLQTKPSHYDFIVYSPNGESLITSDGHSGCIFLNAETFETLHVFKYHNSRALAASFSNDSKRIVVSFYDAAIIIWDLRTFEHMDLSIKHEGPVDHVQFSPDNKYILSASFDGTAILWDAERMTELRTFISPKKHSFCCACFSPSGKLIAITTRSGILSVWETYSGEKKWEIDLNARNMYADTIIMPDECKVLFMFKKKIMRWNLINQIIEEIPIEHAQMRSFLLNKAQSILATLGNDGKTMLWDAHTFKHIHTIHGISRLEVQGVNLCNIHPDSKLSVDTMELLFEYGAIVDERG